MAYIFFLRPRAQEARRQRNTLMELSAGDEVLTGAGIFGTVLDVEPDRVTLETAPGTRITVLRSTIARRITDPGEETPSWTSTMRTKHDGAYQDYEHDHADDEHDEHDHADDEHDAGEEEVDAHVEHDEPDVHADAPDEHDVSGTASTDEHAAAGDEHDEAAGIDSAEGQEP